MKLFKKIFLYSFLILFIGLGIFVVNLIWFKPFSINHFYNKIFLELALDNPELASGLGIPVISDLYNDELSDISQEELRKGEEEMKAIMATLKSYDYEDQSEENKLNTDILSWFLQNQIDGFDYRYNNYPVNQMSGIQIGLPNLMQTAHNIEDEEDAEAYNKRLRAFTTKFEQLMEGLLIREENGIIPPKFIIDITLEGMEDFVTAEPKENSIYTNLGTKLDELGVSGDTKQAFLDECEAAIKENVYPAYQTLIDIYKKWNSSLATNDAGVWKLPNGDKFYEYQIKSHTTVSMTPEEIHQLGLSEVDRIKSQMWDILKQEGYTDTTKTLGAYIHELNTEERFLYPNTDEGREQCINDYQEMINHISANLDGIFNLRPTDTVEVQRVPEFREGGSAGAYYQRPAIDGSRPGIFYTNLRDMNEVLKYGMKTLAYHEAVPGHHFQISIQARLEGVPIFRTILPFTAYSEGWALYAERVAWEQGFYENDPFGDLGRLQAEMFRAVRLVVDSGIHYKKWTREEAIEYMIANTGMTEGEVVSEIERYVVMPGQALAYKVGMIKILEYRQKAMDALGDQFDIAEFHDVVLGGGAVPMSILEEIIDDWIEEKKT
ncbi:MAG: DUF885 domain-containing protein [Cyclobacteriaceae bacterium]